VVDLLEEYLWDLPSVPWARPGFEFHFCQASVVVMHSLISAHTLKEFCGALVQVGLDSIYYHFFEARWRLGELKGDDFSFWIETNFGLPELRTFIELGASPRASLGLIRAGRALALLRGRTYLTPQDVFDVAPEIMRHRLLLSYEALAQDVDVEQVLARVLGTVPAPRLTPVQNGGDPYYGTATDAGAWAGQPGTQPAAPAGAWGNGTP